MCAYKMMPPYGRNETESWTGLFTSMECSSARSLVVVSPCVSWTLRTATDAAGLKAPQQLPPPRRAVCNIIYVDCAIFVFVLRCTAQSAIISAADKCRLMYPTRRSRISYNDDCDIRRRTSIYNTAFT